MAAECLSLMERISARLAGTGPASAANKPVAGKQTWDLLSPEPETEHSPQLPSCAQELVLSDSEDDQPLKCKPDSSRNKHFSFSHDKPRSQLVICDSSDDEFENFLIQLKTPKAATKRNCEKPRSLNDFIVDSEEEDDFSSMISGSGKGLESKNDGKTSTTVPWNNTPVFISDSEEDSIVITSTWRDRHKTKKNVKDSAQKPKSTLKKDKENFLEPPKDKYLGRLESIEKTVPESKFSTPVSSDDEFESLMDRIKKRTNNRTPSSSTSKVKPKTALTEPAKAPCLDLTNKKQSKTKPKTQSERTSSPYFSSDTKEPLGYLESPLSENTRLPCKVPGCFLTDLSCPTSSYVKQFKQKKHELATRLYTLYNRTVFDQKLPENLEILWNKKMRKTAGYCVTGQKKQPTLHRYARIELSEKVCDSAGSPAQPKNSLRDQFQKDEPTTTSWGNSLQPKYTLRDYFQKTVATSTSLVQIESLRIGRHSKSLDTERFVCALCKGKLILQTTTRKDGSPSTTQLTPFAKYVKENYGSAKREMTGMSHAEVMRKLSADFSSKAKLSN